MQESPALIGQSIYEETSVTPEERVFQSVIIQAVKDYITAPEEKRNVRRWVKSKPEVFKFCAMSMGIGMGRLQELMLNKMNEIDRTHEKTFKYSRAV